MTNEALTIGPVRCVWPSLTSPTKFKATRRDGTSVDKYTARFLIPKDDTATMNKLAAAILSTERAQAQYGANLVFGDGANLPKFFIVGIGMDKDNQPFKDGDLVDQPDHKGHFYINASNTNRPPRMVDGQLQQIMDPSVIYSGCFVNVALGVSVYNNRSKGITWFLNDIQFVRGGPEIASGPALDSIFGKVQGAETPAASAPAAAAANPFGADAAAAEPAEAAADPFG